MHLLIMWASSLSSSGPSLYPSSTTSFRSSSDDVMASGSDHSFSVTSSSWIRWVHFLVGLVVALLRRYLLRVPAHLETPRSVPAGLATSGRPDRFWVEGMRLAATGAELGYSPYWSPVGYGWSRVWDGVGPSTIRTWHWFTWWFHGVLALGWVAALPLRPRSCTS